MIAAEELLVVLRRGLHDGTAAEQGSHFGLPRQKQISMINLIAFLETKFTS